jgi:hypothetical protein
MGPIGREDGKGWNDKSLTETSWKLPVEDSMTCSGCGRNPHWHLRRQVFCHHVPKGNAAIFGSPRLRTYSAIGETDDLT